MLAGMHLTHSHVPNNTRCSTSTLYKVWCKASAVATVMKGCNAVHHAKSIANERCDHLSLAFSDHMTVLRSQCCSSVLCI